VELNTIELTFALELIRKLNDELETQDYVEEKFVATTDGKGLWIDFVGDRVFDSDEVAEDYNPSYDLEGDLRCAGHQAVSYHVSSLGHVKLLKNKK